MGNHQDSPGITSPYMVRPLTLGCYREMISARAGLLQHVFDRCQGGRHVRRSLALIAILILSQGFFFRFTPLPCTEDRVSAIDPIGLNIVLGTREGGMYVCLPPKPPSRPLTSSHASRPPLWIFAI